MERRRVDEEPRSLERAAGAVVDLRNARGIVAARSVGPEKAAQLARDRADARRIRETPGLHARRAHAGDGASVLRLVGLPVHRLLRAELALRHAAGLHVLRRRAAPGGD